MVIKRDSERKTSTVINRETERTEKHHENTPIQIYRTFHLQKLKIFRQKTPYRGIHYFSYFCSTASDIDCGYLLQPPRRGGSYEYPQSMFLKKKINIRHTPVNHSFTI